MPFMNRRPGDPPRSGHFKFAMRHPPQSPSPESSHRRLELAVDDFDVREFLTYCLKDEPRDTGYVVTPNADHLIRYAEDSGFRRLYAEARFVLLDSRFLAHLLRLACGVRFKVCPGSDLTAGLFEALRGSAETILLIGATDAQAATLRRDFSLQNLVHHNPPMGFIQDELAVRRCLDVIASAGPSRFCFLALGSPQQEVLARRVVSEAKTGGLVLCIGASINFLTGTERRAPSWMQRAGIEWIYRLLKDPSRLAYRYLVRGPRVFLCLRRVDLVVRKHP